MVQATLQTGNPAFRVYFLRQIPDNIDDYSAIVTVKKDRKNIKDLPVNLNISICMLQLNKK